MERTLIIIKPDATKRNLVGAILSKFEESGFSIVAARMVRLRREDAERFYSVHRERPFFNDLVEYMISGRVLPCVLEGDNAVFRVREIMGATDPSEAADGTIRKLYALSKQENSVHGSDSPENAKLEISFFFPELS